MHKILVTGSDGQLGSELRFFSKEYKNYKYFFTNKKELYICNSSSVQKFVNHHKINVIINCAAYTAIDRAEKKQELAYEINSIGVENLVIVAKKNLCKLIYISTDYILMAPKHLIH
jgi:dTDP-4-dehydrorhamnose reductase